MSCPNCSYDGTNLGLHWSNNPNCDYPELTQHQKDILVGLLLGDATVNNNSGKHAFVQANMISKEFLQDIREELGIFATDVRLSRSAEKSYQNASKYFENCQLENYHDIYRLQTRCIPFATKLNSWYDSGLKKFPSNLQLNKTIAKLWYVCDGNVHWYSDSSNGHVQISATNESDRKEYIKSLFNEVGFTPSFTENSEKVSFSVEESTEFLEWLGEPPKDFRYKWEIRDRDRYSSLKSSTSATSSGSSPSS